MADLPPIRRIAHLHCLYCGGERLGDDSACRKCRADAPSVPCKRCKAAVFAPRDMCICGQPCVAWALAEPHELACPRCNGKLAWASFEGETFHVEQCARCLGCFARTEAFSALVEHEKTHAVVPEVPVVPVQAKRELPRQDLLAEARCPHCAAVMDRVRFAQRAAIVIDVCPKHGVWLDAGELPRVLEHVKQEAAGGAVPDAADRADQAHWDHVLAEKAMESQRLEAGLERAEASTESHRTRNAIIGTAIGGPWVGLFLALRGGGSRR